MTPIFEKPASGNQTIWGPWGRTEDGILSSLRQWWTCDQPTKGAKHKPNENGDRCTHCGARRSKLQTYQRKR